MTATPLISGKAYYVKCKHQLLIVIADHPCQAINIVLDAIGF